MNSARPITTLKRGLCLQAAVALLFSLILSAPHRVHHFFEQYLAPDSTELATVTVHDHGDRRHEDHAPVPAPDSRTGDCAVLTATQNAHALAASSFELALFTAPVAGPQLATIRSVRSFNPSPGSQRAPPLV